MVLFYRRRCAVPTSEQLFRSCRRGRNMRRQCQLSSHGPRRVEFRATIGANTAAPLSVNLSGTGVNPPISLISISPNSAATAGPGFSLTVNGSGFVANSMVYWNGAGMSTALVSSTQLMSAIPASAIAQAGTFQVTAFCPAPGGGTSSPIAFVVANPAINVGGVLNSGSYTNVVSAGELVSIFAPTLHRQAPPSPVFHCRQR